ncbi:MAG: hypothetical protein K940chlam5_01596 [Candidatus Anoxychlamydiales bacterium]|nr:hypothetical protein [Candidatus Anoxychlamydiales bacterium]
MTQSLKKQEFEVSKELNLSLKSKKTHKNYKILILNHLFRTYIFPTKKEKIREIPILQYRTMSTQLKIPVKLVRAFIEPFLADLIELKSFLKVEEFMFSSKNYASQIKIYLHRLHRLAPIFDYKRAKENTKILKLKLKASYFWPRVTTQAAIIIYITDLLDPLEKIKIKQTNLRVLCGCSAYAFHMTRNKIGLSPASIRKHYGGRPSY